MPNSKITQIELNGVLYDINDPEALRLLGAGDLDEIVVLSDSAGKVISSGTTLADIFSRIDTATIIDNVEDGEWIINIVNSDGSIDMSNYYSKSKIDELLRNIETSQIKFTNEQLAVLESGINALKVASYDEHIADTDIHLLPGERESFITQQDIDDVIGDAVELSESRNGRYYSKYTAREIEALRGESKLMTLRGRPVVLTYFTLEDSTYVARVYFFIAPTIQINYFDIVDTNTDISGAGTIAFTVNEYYKKQETYTASQIDQKISTIPKFAIEVVSALPTRDISTTTIYLLTNDGTSPEMYSEYIYVNNNWEKLGSQLEALIVDVVDDEGNSVVNAENVAVIPASIKTYEVTTTSDTPAGYYAKYTNGKYRLTIRGKQVVGVSYNAQSGITFFYYDRGLLGEGFFEYSVYNNGQRGDNLSPVGTIHKHDNYSTLEKFSEENGELKFDGVSIDSNSVTISVVSSLPQTGESNIIYFVPAQTADTQNNYDEYVYISGNWEMIGSTRVDLTDYARIEDTPFEITVSNIGTNSATLDKSWADIIAAYDEGRTINGYRAADSASPKQRYIIETSCLKRTNDFLLTMRYRFFNTSDGLFKEAVLNATYILSSGSVTWNNTVTTINDLSDYATKLYVTNQINGLSAVAKSGRYADLTGLPAVVNDVRDSDGTSLVANGVATIPKLDPFVITALTLVPSSTTEATGTFDKTNAEIVEAIQENREIVLDMTGLIGERYVNLSTKLIYKTATSLYPEIELRYHYINSNEELVQDMFRIVDTETANNFSYWKTTASSPSFVVSDTEPTDTSVLWIDTSDDTVDGIDNGEEISFPEEVGE